MKDQDSVKLDAIDRVIDYLIGNYGDGVEDEFLSFKIQGVTRIRSTLEARYHVVFGGEVISDFPFSFVAPLEA